MFSFVELKQKIKDVEDWLQKELSAIRTGRANVAILDFIQVEAYGSKMEIKELANIVVEDAKSIRIEPWDATVTKSIEKAITLSNLGLSTSPYEKGLRIIFPELTAERREQFVKLVKAKLEEARVSLRGLRDKTSKDIDNKEKEGGMGEDDKFRLKEELQKLIDEANKKLDGLAERKEADIKV